ncbi:MAG TPA: UDP-N-acetylglucosamine--N-acetylmuramyl-(pentapeptide) pyrophosphoryl-undecaprenol N-acetylglucosamine transferase [Candidatus Paceibacterota bacterium]|nr:UDP-N-acetylglucosamine--N-acetylmuramyl-(pentapeptide) pyrophosphoryl-undecaprenol N-acetylglucosamine transferase [Candidatus Paceibacterota bacterium]
MKIVLTGSGTGGHFYPLIAVAEAIEDITTERKLIEPELIYMGPAPFDKTALFEHEIEYKPSTAGKMYPHGSILNVLSVFSIVSGVVQTTIQLFNLYPDVVFSTGGFAAFPTLFAARLLHIPVFIYDADATPGRVSLWSSHFARWIAIAHADAASKFPTRAREHIARVGHPIRKEIVAPTKEGGFEFLRLDSSLPTIFIMGGSQGAQAINETVLDALPELVASYNVIHQTGSAHLDEVTKISSVILKGSPFADHYRPFGLLNTLALRMSAGIATVIVARAGSGSIFEIASWGIPAILVPIPEDVSHDQTENAFSYARAGAAIVIEQRNLKPHVLVSEINRLLTDPPTYRRMAEAAHGYARPDAAHKIATILLESSISHESV